MRKSIFIFSAVAIAFIIGCTEKKSQIPSLKKEAVSKLMTTGAVSGIQLTYFDATNDYTFCAGYRNKSDSSFIDNHSTFTSGELILPIIAAITLKLSDEGLIEIDTPITHYLSGKKFPEKINSTITIRHLLSHTSNIADWEYDDDTNLKPGSKWNFSKKGYTILTQILELQLNKPFSEIATKWLFNPLKLKNSSFQPNTDTYALGHSTIEEPTFPSDSSLLNSFFTNSQDYSLFLRAMVYGNFLSTESKKLFTKPTIDANYWGMDETNPYIYWSAGVGCEKLSEDITLWHWADNNYFQHFFLLQKKSKKGLVYFSNSANGLSIIDSLASIFLHKKFHSIRWIDYEQFTKPGRMTEITLRKGFNSLDSIKSTKVYERLLVKDSNFFRTDNDPISNIVWSLAEKEKLNEASWLITTHLSHFPESAKAYLRLGEIQGLSKDYSTSWQTYQKAMEIDPELSREVLPRLGWYQEAWNALREPTNPHLPVWKYEGTFDEISIKLQDGHFTYTKDGTRTTTLHALDSVTFDLEAPKPYRIRFAIENQEVRGLYESYLSGQQIFHTKQKKRAHQKLGSSN